MKRFALCALVALVSSIAAAQQGYFETFEVRLHNLEVVVTDAKGQPVRGLTKEDFVVLENGAPQNVTNFSVFEQGTGTASSATAAEAQESSPPRRIVFFVDDMGVRKRARGTLLRNATALVDQFQPGDLISVVRPTGANRIAQPYTTDTAAARKALTEAIESCTFRLNSSGQYEIEALVNDLENAKNDNDRAYASRQYSQRATSRVKQRLGQLRALIGSMAGMEGRKVVVLITSGLPAVPGRRAGMDLMRFGSDPMRTGQDARSTRPVTNWEEEGDLTPLIDELGRTAAANGVTIYALEPEVPLGLAAQQKTAGTDVTESSYLAMLNGNREGQEVVPTEMYGEMMQSRAETLRSLSERTGGRWFRGVGTIDDVFRQVATDLSVYYSLAYRATGEHDKPRRVEVRVRNRPDLKVRTRTEVIDRSPEREMGDLVAATLLFPRNVNELDMELETGEPSGKGHAVTVPLDVVIPLRMLTFLPTHDGHYAATIDIHYATAGIESSYTTSGHQQNVVEISEQQFAAREDTSYRFKTGVEVWRGPTRIAVGVIDPASKLAAFRTTDVTAE